MWSRLGQHRLINTNKKSWSSYFKGLLHYHPALPPPEYEPRTIKCSCLDSVRVWFCHATHPASGALDRNITLNIVRTLYNSHRLGFSMSQSRGNILLLYVHYCSHSSLWAGALLQWLRLPTWKGGDRVIVPLSGIQVSKKQNVSSPLTRKDSVLWATAAVTIWGHFEYIAPW